jgi:hypothetical protein
VGVELSAEHAGRSCRVDGHCSVCADHAIGAIGA